MKQVNFGSQCSGYEITRTFKVARCRECETWRNQARIVWGAWEGDLASNGNKRRVFCRLRKAHCKVCTPFTPCLVAAYLAHSVNQDQNILLKTKESWCVRYETRIIEVFSNPCPFFFRALSVCRLSFHHNRAAGIHLRVLPYTIDRAFR